MVLVSNSILVANPCRIQWGCLFSAGIPALAAKFMNRSCIARRVIGRLPSSTRNTGPSASCSIVVASPKKSQVIALILEGNTQRRAAQEAGVSEETVSRWKAEDAQFASTLENTRRDLCESQAQKLLDLSGKAIDTLAELLKSEDEGIRLRASQAVLKATMPEPPNPLQYTEPKDFETIFTKREAKQEWDATTALLW